MKTLNPTEIKVVTAQESLLLKVKAISKTLIGKAQDKTTKNFSRTYTLQEIEKIKVFQNAVLSQYRINLDTQKATLTYQNAFILDVFLKANPEITKKDIIQVREELFNSLDLIAFNMVIFENTTAKNLLTELLKAQPQQDSKTENKKE